MTNGVCCSWTDTACFSASSKTLSPVVLAKSATTMTSRSVNAGVRVEFQSQNPATASTSTAGTPTSAQRGVRRAITAGADTPVAVAAAGVAPD